jgi:hypothetical protein
MSKQGTGVLSSSSKNPDRIGCPFPLQIGPKKRALVREMDKGKPGTSSGGRAKSIIAELHAQDEKARNGGQGPLCWLWHCPANY